MDEPREPFSIGNMPIELAAWPASTGCGACARPWSAHDVSAEGVGPDEPFPCATCGAPLSTRCFYQYIATAAELARYHDPEDDMDGVTFQCRGCRS